MENKIKKNRQSTDFKEIWNIQTDLNVTQDAWDNIFHTWEDATKCPGNHRTTGCVICEQLKTKGYVIRKNGNIYSSNLLIVGDIHSNYAGLQKIINSRIDLTAVISVGDLALWKNENDAMTDKKAYYKTKTQINNFIKNPVKFKIPIYMIKGNHDDFDNMYSDWFKSLNIHYIRQADILSIGNLRIGCLGGIYSPVKYTLDSKNFVKREKRFYTLSEIEALKNTDIDILITHQAAADVLEKKDFMKDEGSKYLQDLFNNLNPRYYIHGHHHINYKKVYNKTTIYGLGNFCKNENSYIIINTLTKEVKDFVSNRPISSNNKKI